MAPVVVDILTMSPRVHQQAYFAFAGEQSGQAETGYGLVILGWAIVALLGSLYALSPRVRKMVPRYFWNHRFYQEAIRRGREVIPVETTTVLIAICGAMGLFAAVWLDLVQMSDAFTTFVRSLPPPIQTVVTQLVRRSWIAVILVGAVTGLVLILWAGWLVLISKRLGQSIRYEQAFMLTVWPHWILFVPAGLAWITAGTAAIPPGALFLTWLAGMAYATVRVWIDLRVVARLGTASVMVLAIGSPLCLLAIAITALAAGQEMEITALWRLIRGG